MPSHVQENNNSVSRVLISPIQQMINENILDKQISRSLDTIEEAEKQKKKKQVATGARPALPKPRKSKHVNALVEIADAFANAFESQSRAAIEQTKSFAQLQQLDETMSHSVLRSTQLAIEKQDKMNKIASEIAHYEKECAEKDRIFGDVLLAIGIVIIAVTIVSSVVDFGTSLAAMPEIAGALGAVADAGSSVLSTIVDCCSPIFDTLDETADDAFEMTDVSDVDDPIDTEDNLENDLSEIEDPSQTQSTQENNEVENAQKETDNEVDTTSKEESKSKERLKKWGARFLRMATAFVFASPMLVQGIQGFKTASKLNDLSRAQKQVGNAVAKMQEINMYFRFYQELTQRAGSVAEQQTNDASEIVQTWGDITNAYKGITYGLANAV